MNSLVSKKLWGQDFSFGYFLIHTKKKSVLFLFMCWGFCCFCLEEHCSQNEGLHGGSVGKKNPPAVRETPVRSLGREDPLEKGAAVDSCLENPRDKEPSGLPGCWRGCTELPDAPRSCPGTEL